MTLVPYLVRLPASLKAAVEARAKSDDVPQAEVVRLALQAWLREDET